MEIKEVMIDSELNKVKEFLSHFGLTYQSDTEKTFYALIDEQIVGTVSITKNLIKQLAVSEKMQGENLAVTLVSEAESYLRSKGIVEYRAFTKPQYKNLFISMGFSVIVESDKFVALESGSSIVKEVEKLKTKLLFEASTIEPDTAGVVINGNPFTLGHLSLIEQALSEHKRVIVFVLEEEGSEFTFKERYSLCYLATKPLGEVYVLPSTQYIVSKSTFPSYFLHSADEHTEEFAKYDAMVFEKYFMKELGISQRYFGGESQDYMQIYNKVQQQILGDKSKFVDRFTLDGQVISAKTIRNLLKEGKLMEATKFIPQACRGVFMGIAGSKQWT